MSIQKFCYKMWLPPYKVLQYKVWALLLSAGTMEAPAVLHPKGKHSENAVSILTHNTAETNSTYSGLYMGSQ